MAVWTPDVELSEQIVQSLIESNFPNLAPVRLKFLGAGFDNQAYLVNDDVVFRIPHRKMGGELMAIECAALAHLNQSAFPLQIPNPAYVAEPSDVFPYPIAGYPIVPGTTADRMLWTDDARSQNAATLGAFLSKLHRIPTDVESAIGDTIRRADLKYRLPIILKKSTQDSSEFRDLLTELAETEPWNQRNVWVHGDLYSRHLVANSSGLITGVIDWGDTHVGDPALDLAIAWMFLPPDSWPAFKTSYGPIDHPTWRRAQFRAMTHCVYLREYAQETKDEALLLDCAFVMKNVISRAGD